ncbi:MAG: hypothetical protein R6X02_22135 [Enhygromyxa sp.]
MIFTRVAVLGALLTITAGCRCPTDEQRAEAAFEGRNLRGSSPRSRDDRIPELSGDLVEPGDPVEPQPAWLAGAFAYASCEVRAIRALLSSLPMPGEIGELIALLDTEPAARVSASARVLDAGIHVRAHLPVKAPERFVAALAQRLRSSADDPPICAALESSAVFCGGVFAGLLIVRAAEQGHVADLFTGAAEPPSPASIEAALALPGGHSRPELEGLRGDAIVLIDGARAAEAVGADLALRETERLFTGMTFELSITRARVLGRGRWLLSDQGRERVRSVFELDPVDADVPSVAALCEGALVCARSRGIPARSRFAALATGIYADPDSLPKLLEQPSAALVLLLETWPNAIASLLAPRPDAIAQNAAEIGARALGFGLSLRSKQRFDEGWVAYARMSGADLEAIRLLSLLEGTSFVSATIPELDRQVELRPLPAFWPRALYTMLDPGEAWGYAIVAERHQHVAWLAGLPRDDGAVPIVYVEVPDLEALLWANPFGAAIDPRSLSDRSLRAQLSLTPNYTPELRFALGLLD